MKPYRQPRKATDRKAAAEHFAMFSTRSDAEKLDTLMRSYALSPDDAADVIARVNQGRLGI